MAATTNTAKVVPPDVELIEAAKRKAAFAAVKDHFRSDMHFVGIGSGSTIVYGIEAIKQHLVESPPPQGHLNWFIPTGWNSKKVLEAAGLMPLTFDSLPRDASIEVCFDGADEVDEDMNCIKGGGACLFQEKLVALRSKKFICIADYRKAQKRLLTQWPSIPIEVAPIAQASVIRELIAIGSSNPILREHTLSKTGPVQTDQSFYIVDAPFQTLLSKQDVEAGADGSGKDGVWEVNALARRIKDINGVLEVGLFHGMNGNEARAVGFAGGQKPIAVYFGLQNGDVGIQDSNHTVA